MNRFHKVKIKGLNKVTHDCVTITLDVPEHLRETFKFTQGQYLTFKRVIDGKELRRSYSICSSPMEDEWTVAVKKVPKGLFSSYANEKLQVGEELEVMPPMGHFYTQLDEKNEKQYVAIAAGSGITPIFSIIKTILMLEPKSQVYLIYGNKGRNSIIFKEEIEALKDKYLERISIYHILSREQGGADLLTGRIDKQKIKLFLEKLIDAQDIDEYFICGPEEMIFEVKEALLESGVEHRKIHFELFATGKKAKRVTHKSTTPQKTHDKLSLVTVKLDNAELNFQVSYFGNTILEEALEQGADLPYSCKGGVCSTCKAKILEGKVEMDTNYSLEDEEVKAGYILTCQSHPITERVIVDFDA